MKNYIYLFLFGILMFGLTFLVASNFFDKTHKEVVSEELEKARAFRNISEGNLIKETSSVENIKLGANSQLIIDKTYKCGHCEQCVNNVEKDMVNLTEDQFKRKYPMYDIKSFSYEKVEVEECVNEVCNEHFKISIGDDFVEVYKMNNGEEELYMVTNICREYLAQSDLDKLAKGIEVYGRENINSKLEDYE